jgi:hypothetical protein
MWAVGWFRLYMFHCIVGHLYIVREDAPLEL